MGACVSVKSYIENDSNKSGTLLNKVSLGHKFVDIQNDHYVPKVINNQTDKFV